MNLLINCTLTLCKNPRNSASVGNWLTSYEPKRLYGKKPTVWLCACGYSTVWYGNPTLKARGSLAPT
jgi:hypothetical protein